MSIPWKLRLFIYLLEQWLGFVQELSTRQFALHKYILRISDNSWNKINIQQNKYVRCPEKMPIMPDQMLTNTESSSVSEWFFVSWWGMSHIDFRTQCIIMTQSRWPTTTTSCHMHHSQNLDKIDSFLKPILNIICCNVIVQWGRGY